jgi:tryptophan synthase alpha chain
VAHSGGFEKYCRGAAAAGINAFLPLDLPPEEYENYRRTIDDSGIKVINLIAPTTKKERIRLLCESSNAFIYYVCREGVTGERKDFASGVDRKIATIKKHTSLPVAVGFGISTPEQVKAASSAGADGVIVGSAIVRKVEALSKGKGTLDDIKTFVRSLRQALN